MNRHLSEDEVAQWLSGDRRVEVEGHLRECARCAAEVAATERTFALFRESGREWSSHWYREEPATARPSPRRLAWAMAAVATACAVAGAILLRPAPKPRQQDAAAEGPFLEMPYVAPLAPYERIEVVRMTVPVAELAAEGLDVRAPDTGASVLADVVFGQDGRPHAIRLVSEQKGSVTP